MSYQSNAEESDMIRNRMRQILEHKMMDRTYKGSSLVGGARKRGARAGYARKSTRRTGRRSSAGKHKQSMQSDEIAQIMSDVIGRKSADTGKLARHISSFLAPARSRRSAGMKNPKRVTAGRRASQKNTWIIFYRNWLKTHPNVSGKIAAKAAAVEYNRCKHVIKSSIR